MLESWLNKRNEKLETINFIAGILLVCCMPFSTHRLPIFLNLWLLTWLLEGNFKAKFKANYSIQNRNLLILGVLFYLSYVIGLLFTPDLKVGSVDLVQKLSLLLAPVLLFGASEKYYKKTYVIFLFFIGANFLSGGICVYLDYIDLKKQANFQLSYNYLKSVDTYYFVHAGFSKLIHPAYFGMYILMSIISMYIIFLNKKFRLRFKYILLVLLSICFFIYFQLLSSRSNIIAVVFILFFYFSYTIWKTKQKWFFFSILFLSFLTLFKYSFKVERMKNVRSVLNFTSKVSLLERLKKVDARIDIWRSSVDAINEAPIFGVGTGNERNAISAKMGKYNSSLIPLKYDSHNQFFQNYLGQGFIGVFLLSLILILSFYNSFKNNNFLLFYFVLLITINLLFESVLQMIGGITFFSFFLYLLNYIKVEESENL